MTKFGPWKIWNGGENPCPGGRVQWQPASGTRVAAQDSSPRVAEMLDWSHNGFCSDIIAYREVIEPARVTMSVYGGQYNYGWSFVTIERDHDTHRITFDLIDGEPDCASIRMERLK